MRLFTGVILIGSVSGILLACSDGGFGSQDELLKGAKISRNSDATGVFGNYSSYGDIDTSNPFFQSLGTNGRACATCHRPENGFSLRTDTANAIFDATTGNDPLFAPVDGTNSPNADVSTETARRAASSLLLSRGVIRIGLPVPSNAEFTVVSIQDPYKYATTSNLSLYRRPLPATNLAFIQPKAIMNDGREPSLQSQANNATIGHAQGSPLTVAQQNAIVDFETHLYTAQVNAADIGELLKEGGGPVALSEQPFKVNENSPKGIPFNPTTNVAFTLYGDWNGSPDPHKAAVLRGQNIFNTRALGPDPVGGSFTCSTCHAAFNVGSNDHNGPLTPGPGQAVFSQIGTAGGGFTAAAAAAQFLSADMPVYTLKNKKTNAIFKVTDPGRALITGRWVDVGLFKIPGLRGLAAHAPYFHNGLAATLEDVVDFYNVSFVAQIKGTPLTDAEKADLVEFLKTL